MHMKTNLATIELLLLDVDGVLTDGGVTYSDTGDQIKKFHSRDGFGIRLLMDSGIQVGIITGRKSKALEHRCKDLGITLLFDGIKNKSTALDKIIAITGILPDKIGFVGDDLMDLCVMTKVGISFCVSDACPEVLSHSDIITDQKGGHGAVREICEAILKAKGVWDVILDNYLS